MDNEFNICINTTSLSQLTSKEELNSLLKKCIENGIRNIELNEINTKNKEHVLKLFNDVKDYGGNIVVLTLELNMLSGDVRSNEKYFNDVKNWIKICSENQCRILRLKAIPRDRKTYSESDFNLLYRNFLNILPSIEKNSVKVSIDTIETAYESMDRFLTMVEDIGSEMVGVTLDMRVVDRLVEKGMLERIVPLVNHVSVKDNYLKNPARNRFESFFKTLKKAAYTGYVSLEIQNSQNIETIVKEFNAFKEILRL